MSEADRDKWNARYRDGAYEARTHPTALLAAWLPRLELRDASLRAIDLGCGAGRNALYLARNGWSVDAVDIAEAALDRLAGVAARESLPITCTQADLEPPDQRALELLRAARYHLALVIRYTNLALMELVKPALKRGGYLIVEEHLDTDADVVGPKNPRFRVAPGVLRRSAAGLDIIYYGESELPDPDGRRAAVAQLVARAPR